MKVTLQGVIAGYTYFRGLLQGTVERIIAGYIGEDYCRLYWKGLLQIILERLIAGYIGKDYCR